MTCWSRVNTIFQLVRSSSAALLGLGNIAGAEGIDQIKTTFLRIHGRLVTTQRAGHNCTRHVGYYPKGRAQLYITLTYSPKFTWKYLLKD